jgi:hypothetical protein
MAWAVYAATAVAVAATALRMGAGLALNRIFFALTLYFISGSIALATRWPWLNELYGRMEATTMLWWVRCSSAPRFSPEKAGCRRLRNPGGVENTWRARRHAGGTGTQGQTPNKNQNSDASARPSRMANIIGEAQK